MTSDKCYGWLSPRATKRALIRCSSLMNVQLVDPVDKVITYLCHISVYQDIIGSQNKPNVCIIH